MTTPRRLGLFLLVPTLLLATAGCRLEANGEAAGQWTEAESTRDQASTDPLAAVRTTLDRATALADSIEDLLRPVPLMRPADEDALRRYSNDENVRTARELGARPADSAELSSLVASGRLVRLEDSTEHWVVRELGASQPYVTPGTRDLIESLAESFQAELRQRGLPAYRFEISSVLRTPEGQAALRQRNVNAAAGTSAHEFGTTVDIVYEAYASPAELPEGLIPAGVPAEERALLERIARLALERVSSQKSRELKAILGEVMREAQARGEVLVTLERQQPVYHITVGR